MNVRLVGAYVCGLAACWSVATLYAVHGGMPHNPVHLPLENPVSISTVMPEGWAFFTRSPREEYAVALTRIGDRWAPASFGTHNSATNLFGIVRKSRAQAVEVGALVAKVPSAKWVECQPDESDEDCLGHTPINAATVNAAAVPSLCGSVGVVKRLPVPWAWARANARRAILMPAKALRVEVQC